MKVTIAYLPEERPAAEAAAAEISRLSAGTKVRASRRHLPFLHLYLTIPIGGAAPERTAR